MSLLEQAKAERDRLNKVIELLEGGDKPAKAAPKRAAGKNSPTSKSYWTPERRRQMSLKIKALQKKKPQGAKKA